MTANQKETIHANDYQLKTTPIAIIGMGSIFPQAHNTSEYWDNILRKIDCIMDVPASRWKIEDYYDPDPSAPDKTYCKRGAFIPDIDFDPMEFGLPPNILEVTDVSQLLSLVVARDALRDAGYGEDRVFNRENTGVVLGVVGMSSKLFTPLMNRLQYPVWEKVLRASGVSEEDTQKIIEKIKLAYVGWEENAFPGAIGNVIAGRICNRFDLGGTNCVVDAACASSLAALRMAVAELIEGRADMMISGGVDADNTINTYMCFSKTPAFSKGERVRTFDAESDGMMVGEGIGMVVLKRLADAERDGDRIYAVIKAIGTSSDGRFKSIYAPRSAGQAKALRRAYQEAGFSPATVGLIEAHGTGTMAGDPAEFQGICEVFGENNPRTQYIALGSVKSQIAHTKAAAGVASLIKTSLALYHKVLPATINVNKPNPKFGIEKTPFYINTETRPWIRAQSGVPRRAGVSSFGFGGTNFHVVMEEYQADHEDAYRINTVAQPVLLSAASPSQLLDVCRAELTALKSEKGQQRFAELTQSSRTLVVPQESARIGFVAESLEEAQQLMQVCIDGLAEKSQAESWEHPKGVYYRKSGLETQGRVVALFSGQGSQYLEMGRELAINFPVMRQVFGQMDELFIQDGLEPLSSRVYPRPVFDPKEREQLNEALQRTEHAQPAIGAFSASLYKLLQMAGFKADFVAGHSFGELTALWAAGVLNDQDYYTLAKARGKAMAAPDDPNFDAGTMMAVKGDVIRISELLKDDSEITLANWNSNNQVVIAGSKAAIARAQQTLNAQGFSTIPLPVSAAFHTPLVGHAQKPFADAVQSVTFNRPAVKVYANGTAKPHAEDPKAIQKALKSHILNPVLFRDEIQNIYADGGRIFVEFGPKNVLTNLVSNILEGQPHLAVALNASPKKDSDRQLREAVMALRVAGLALDNFDPYAVAKPAAPERKQSPVTVKLNAGYYITEKTRAAFENALNDGFRISAPAGNAEPVSEAPAPVVPAATPSPVQQVETQPAPVLNTDTVEQLLAEYQTHQEETMRLHEQYLRTEEEYARAFAQLTQLQTELVSKGASEAGQLQSVIPLFESLERSMTRFHEHQAETLRVHQRYLETQENFSQTFVHGVTQAVALPASGAQPAVRQTVVRVEPAVVKPANGNGNGNGKGNGNGHHKVAVFDTPELEAKPAPAVEAAPASVLAAPVAPAPTGLDPAQLTSALLQIVSEKTGYPVETLELDMDMEADLGIDSIKRVEILGAVQTQFPNLPKLDPTQLTELHTLGQIVTEMSASLGAVEPTTVAVPAEPVVPAPVTPAALPNSAAGIDVKEITTSLLAVVSEKTGYPVETLELDMDMEADLGIDSIKRVEILGAMQTSYPDLPKLQPEVLTELRTLGQIIDHMSTNLQNETPSAGVIVEEPTTSFVAATPTISAVDAAPGVGIDAKQVQEALLNVVSEKTGYPVETLELDMDMEADLGIDSIKRVEILGAMQAQFPQLPRIEAEQLAELCTLRQIIDTMSAVKLEAAAESSAEGKVLPFEVESNLGVEQGIVTRKILPAPDMLNFNLPEGHICLMTDDGTPVAPALAEALLARGWNVVVLRFPAEIVGAGQALPEKAALVNLDDMSEAHLQARLSEIAEKHGPIGIFIHLAPCQKVEDVVAVSFPETEKALMKLIFLIAKHLKTPLNNAAQKGRAAFMTVTRMDGAFGLGQGTEYAPVNGGLFGLVKTLNLEWEPVFCRAIDLSPALDTARAVECILVELHDPNRLLIEVGYTPEERSTLTIEAVPVTGGIR